MIRLAGEPEVGCGLDPALAGVADRFHCLDERWPHLDLDDGNEVAAPRNNVDLAELRAVAALNDAKALQHQGKAGDPFAAMAATLVQLAAGAPVSRHRLSVP